MTRVVLNEVGLRDGLQAQAKHLTVAERCELLDALVTSGLESIEIGSFVSPKAVPQMASTDEVLAYALAQHPSARYNALVPNRRGYDAAVAAGCREVNLVISATDTMNQKNINMTTAEIMAVSQQLIGSAREQNVIANAYLAVAFECPFEGSVNPDHVVSLAQRLIGFGAHRVVIADTIGAASPFDVADLLSACCEGWARTNSPVIFTIRERWGWRMFMRRSLPVFASLIRRLVVWVGVHLRRVHRAMWRRKTSPYFVIKPDFKRESIWLRCLKPCSA